MKKACILVCSLLVAVTLAFGIVSSSAVNVPQEAVTLCDLDYGRVSF